MERQLVRSFGRGATHILGMKPDSPHFPGVTKAIRDFYERHIPNDPDEQFILVSELLIFFQVVK